MKRLISGALGAATAATSLAAIGLLTAGPANASACSGDSSFYLDVTSHSTYYLPVYGPFADDNGTSRDAHDSFQSKVSKSVSSKVDASVDASIGDVIASVKASVSKTVTKTQAVSITHTVSYTIAPHTVLHIEYAVRQVHAHLHRYRLNGNCDVINSTWGYAYVDNGVGWHTWVTKYGT
jgi:hypothetical protein